ncbi:alpha-N-acetylglucosaminidase-like [Camellia sinensis]|uniref:alpha-N-acetylglucosaminidase-like n=1 Tax=Camellia sinensis TaxID=4442 RepID=UPI001035E25C|nr:alpha-N-acetylglucosaminidase-like [Camellia sinensis]
MNLPVILMLCLIKKESLSFAVLPSFSGNVPGALKDIFPSANITRLGDWNTVDGDTRWCCTFLLDPSDPLFVEIGKAFIKRQIKGAIHVS